MDSVISIGLIVIVAVVFIGAVIMEKKKYAKTIGDCNEAYNAGNRKCNGDKLL